MVEEAKGDMDDAKIFVSTSIVLLPLSLKSTVLLNQTMPKSNKEVVLTFPLLVSPLAKVLQ